MAQQQPTPTRLTLPGPSSSRQAPEEEEKKEPLLSVGPQKCLSHPPYINHGKDSTPQPGREKAPFSSVWLHGSQHKSSALTKLSLLTAVPPPLTHLSLFQPHPQKVTGLGQFHFAEKSFHSLSCPLCSGGQLGLLGTQRRDPCPPWPLSWAGAVKYFLIFKALAARLRSASQHQ